MSFSSDYFLLSARNTLKILFDHLAHLTCREAWDLFALIIDCEQSDFSESEKLLVILITCSINVNEWRCNTTLESLIKTQQHN